MKQASVWPYDIIVRLTHSIGKSTLCYLKCWGEGFSGYRWVYTLKTIETIFSCLDLIHCSFTATCFSPSLTYCTATVVSNQVCCCCGLR